MSMVLELARIRVTAGMEKAFEEGVAKAAPLFLRARGCRSLSLGRIEEDPSVYLLMVDWETLEDHTVTFRGSEDFQAWRKLVGHCFAEPPKVEHLNLVARNLGA
jgi:heme-degrading monooxygenase HmoA